MANTYDTSSLTSRWLFDCLRCGQSSRMADFFPFLAIFSAFALMSAWKRLCLAYILLVLVLQVVLHLLVSNSTSYRHSQMKRIKIVVNAELLFFLLSIFMWRRVVCLFDPPVALRSKEDRRQHQITMRPYRLVASMLAAGVGLGAQILYVFYWMQSWTPRSLLYLCALSLGVWTYLVGLLLCFSLLNFVTRAIQATSCGSKLLAPFVRFRSIEKLLLSPNFQTLTALVLTAILTLQGIYSAGHYVVHNVTVGVKNLPSSADGLRLAVLSDIHVGGVIGAQQVLRVVDRTNEIKPDAVLIIGDLVDGSVEELGSEIKPLQQLQSKYGTYFVTGNHEYYHGNVDEWIQLGEKLRITTLRNSHVKLGDICLVGVDDVSAQASTIDGHAMNIEKAVNGCDPSAPIVAMAHNPISARAFIAQSKRPVHLVLSGHVHAGQYYIMAPVIYLLMPFYHGLYSVNPHTQLYVSAGVHYWGAPVKMHGLAEISLIRLTKA